MWLDSDSEKVSHRDRHWHMLKGQYLAGHLCPKFWPKYWNSSPPQQLEVCSASWMNRERSRKKLQEDLTFLRCHGTVQLPHPSFLRTCKEQKSSADWWFIFLVFSLQYALLCLDSGNNCARLLAWPVIFPELLNFKQELVTKLVRECNDLKFSKHVTWSQ